MRILSLDLALKSGYAVLDDGVIKSYGVIHKAVENWVANITVYTQYPPNFPNNLAKVAKEIAMEVGLKYDEFQPDLVVVEDTSRGRNRTVQKLLEFIHFAVFDCLQSKSAKTLVLTNKCWRDAVGAYATDEERKMNSKIGRLKRKRKEELEKRTDLSEEQRENILKSGVKVDGKVTGKKKTKHFSIRVVEQEFGLKFKNKDDDVSDALLLGLAAYRIKGPKP